MPRMRMILTGSVFNDTAERIHGTARAHGFWSEGRNMGEMLMLAVSELAEALESHRDGEDPVWYKHEAGCPIADHKVYGMSGELPACECRPKPEGVAVELADCIIRCLDTIRGNFPEIDIDQIIEEKMVYNDSRPYKHGRAY